MNLCKSVKWFCSGTCRIELLQEIQKCKETTYNGLSDTLKYFLIYSNTRLTTRLRNKLFEKHSKKLHKLQTSSNDSEFQKNKSFISNTIHNLSSYELSLENLKNNVKNSTKQFRVYSFFILSVIFTVLILLLTPCTLSIVACKKVNFKLLFIDDSQVRSILLREYQACLTRVFMPIWLDSSKDPTY